MTEAQVEAYAARLAAAAKIGEDVYNAVKGVVVSDVTNDDLNAILAATEQKMAADAADARANIKG